MFWNFFRKIWLKIFFSKIFFFFFFFEVDVFILKCLAWFWFWMSFQILWFHLFHNAHSISALSFKISFHFEFQVSSKEIKMSHFLFSCVEFYTCGISLSDWSALLPLWHKHPVTTRWRGQPGHGKAWLGKGAVKLTDGEVIRGAWVIGFSQSLKIECGWCNSPREWCNVKNVWQTFWDL